MRTTLFALLFVLALVSTAMAEGAGSAQAPAAPAAPAAVAPAPNATAAPAAAPAPAAPAAVAPADPAAPPAAPPVAAPPPAAEPPKVVAAVPDVKKVEDTAAKEAEGAGWGTYGTILVLLAAAVLAFLKLKKKGTDNTPKG